MLLTVLDLLAKYGAVAFGTVLDHSGLPLPLLVATAGAGEFDLAPSGAVLAATLGAFAGDLVLYEVGRRTGKATMLSGRIARSFGNIPQQAIAAVERRPVLGLTLYRFLPAVGKYAPLAAGLSRVPRRRALLACMLGTTIYCACFGALGVLLQPAAVHVLADSKRVWHSCAVLVTVVILYGLLRRHGRATASVRPLGPEADDGSLPVEPRSEERSR